MSRPFLIGIFSLSMALRLWFNFAFPHINNAGAADGSEYLRAAEALRQFFSHPDSHLSQLKGLSQAGPVFPLFILSCQLVGGVFAAVPDWMPPVFGQCLLASFADLFLCLTANLIWGRGAAIACAFFSIFYPAFLINSGRLYTESFATSLVTMILYVLCRGFVSELRGWHTFFLGFGLAALQLTRSAMVLFSFVSLPLIFWQQRKYAAVKSVLLLFLGMSVILVPWLFAQKAIFNKASLVVDRVGNYNLFVGTNPDISGWLSYPYPDGTGVEKRTAVSVLYANIRRSPSRFMKLLLDKPYRLAKFPWNDFRTDVGFFTFPLQVAYHQILLLLFTVGISLAFVRNVDGTDVDRRILKARLMLFLYLACHVIYLFFITVPRYNMTAVPVLILFAGAGAAAFLTLARQNIARAAILLNAFLLFFLAARLNEIGTAYWITGNTSAALAALCFVKGLCATVFFFLIWRLPAPAFGQPVLAKTVHIGISFLTVFLVAYPARANGRTLEWQTLLSQKGDRVVQQISLRKADVDKFKQRNLYLLIDTDGAKGLIENGQVRVNGEILDGPLIPSIALLQDFSCEKKNGKREIYYECEWIYDCMSASAGIASSEIRQWFVMAVPLKAVQSILASQAARIEIENVSGRHPFKIFGSYLPESKAAPLPSILSASWEKAFYGVETDAGFTDSRYDAKLDLARHERANFSSNKGRQSPDLSASPGRQTGAFNLLLTAAGDETAGRPAILAPPLPEKISISAGEKRSFDAKVSFNSPAGLNEIWLFRLRGRSFSPKGRLTVEPKVDVIVQDSSGKELVYPCRWMPRSLPNENSAANFDYCFPMLPALIKEKISSINIKLASTDRNSALGSTLEIADFCVEIVPLQANPIAQQNGIY